jgi:hypothetical protein
MTEEHEAIDTLIHRVVQRTTPGVATSGAAAMLNLIPYAGGAVATILSEFASQRRIEKVCEVLSELNAALRRHGLSAETHLSRDQVVELVYETLQAASFASDQGKVDALKGALVHAFVSPQPFDRKQLFLQILRETTNVELIMLRVLYEAPDPFVVGRGGPERTPDNASPRHPNIPRGFWHTEGRAENKGGQSLLKYLAARATLDSAIVEAALRRLDGRGLASAGPNLDRSDWKIVSWLPMPEEHIRNLQTASIGYEAGKEVRSPLEASRTKLGEEFLKVWNSPEGRSA